MRRRSTHRFMGKAIRLLVIGAAASQYVLVRRQASQPSTELADFPVGAPRTSNLACLRDIA